MTLLVETHLFKIGKVRIMQNKIFSGGKNIRKILKINQNRHFFWLSIRF